MSKTKLADFVLYGKLFEIYGGLLSADRQSIMKDYFFCNMTLAEIASERHISRQAVSDAIDKSCEKLQEYEKVLSNYAKTESLRQDLQSLLQNPSETLEKVEEILRKL